MKKIFILLIWVGVGCSKSQDATTDAGTTDGASVDVSVLIDATSDTTDAVDVAQDANDAWTPVLACVTRNPSNTVLACSEVEAENEAQLRSDCAMTQMRLDTKGLVGYTATTASSCMNPELGYCFLRGTRSWNFPPVTEAQSRMVCTQQGGTWMEAE